MSNGGSPWPRPSRLDSKGVTRRSPLSAIGRIASATKIRLSPWLHTLAGATGASLALAIRASRARIFAYHTIADPRLLETQVAFLRRHFEIVSLPELASRLERRQLRGREAVLTFDDGVRNHHRTVYPVLARQAAPATFFVCPGLVEERRWIWNMELRARLQSLDHASRAAVAQDLGCPSAAVEGVVEWAKGLEPRRRQEAEALVRARTPGFQPTPEQADQCAPLSWEEIASFDPRLVTIGSHTVTHPILPTLTGDEVRREVAESRRMLEARLGREVDCFCYPNGSLARETVRLVAETYRCAVTVEPAFVSAESSEHRLPRIPAADTQALFEWRLHRPGA